MKRYEGDSSKIQLVITRLWLIWVEVLLEAVQMRTSNVCVCGMDEGSE